MERFAIDALLWWRTCMGWRSMQRALIILTSVLGLYATTVNAYEITPASRANHRALQSPLLSDVLVGHEQISRTRIWAASGRRRAIVVAVHGLNDHGGAFDLPARTWSRAGIATYAIDLRGFGHSGQFGRWAGRQAVIGDVTALVRRLHKVHSRTPIILVGESFGGSVAILAAAQLEAGAVAGLVLAAPAALQPRPRNRLMRRLTLTVSKVVPGLTVSAINHDRPATDDPEILRRLQSDPQIRHSTRLDMLSGVVDVMSRAPTHIARLKMPMLIMLGDSDERISRSAVADLAARAGSRAHLALYPNGPHLLLRSRDRATIIADTTAWILRPGRKLPSGADARGAQCAGVIDDPATRCAIDLRLVRGKAPASVLPRPREAAAGPAGG